MNQAADVIREVNITEISPFPNHPFIIRNDELMFELIGSIKQFGVLTPAIVRMTEDGTLQMLSGHRRLRACEIIGLKTIPAVITDVDLDEATVIMVLDFMAGKRTRICRSYEFQILVPFF